MSLSTCKGLWHVGAENVGNHCIFFCSDDEEGTKWRQEEVGNKIRLQTFPLKIFFFSLVSSGLVFSLLTNSELVVFHLFHSLNFYFIFKFYFFHTKAFKCESWHGLLSCYANTQQQTWLPSAYMYFCGKYGKTVRRSTQYHLSNDVSPED